MQLCRIINKNKNIDKFQCKHSISKLILYITKMLPQAFKIWIQIAIVNKYLSKKSKLQIKIKKLKSKCQKNDITKELM